MEKYIILVEFATSDDGDVFYMAHVFKPDMPTPERCRVWEITVTAGNPEDAIARAKDVAWLLE